MRFAPEELKVVQDEAGRLGVTVSEFIRRNALEAAGVAAERRLSNLEDVGVDYGQFYNLDSYLTDVVRPRFLVQGFLLATDLSCIIIWKANRAKSREAKKLLGRG